MSEALSGHRFSTSSKDCEKRFNGCLIQFFVVYDWINLKY
jgi:hypothetical protein